MPEAANEPEAEGEAEAEAAVTETLPATPAPTAADATDASPEGAFAAAARAFAGQSSSLTASGEILLLGLDDATLKDMRLAFDSFEPGDNDQIRSGQVGMTLVGPQLPLSRQLCVVSLSNRNTCVVPSASSTSSAPRP